MEGPELYHFGANQEMMIRVALDALAEVGYEISRFKELIWADMPSGFRAMCLDDGAALGNEAFSSQAMLNHVLEEEYLHLIQKSLGIAEDFAKGTARQLEYDIEEPRKFAKPDR